MYMSFKEKYLKCWMEYEENAAKFTSIQSNKFTVYQRNHLSSIIYAKIISTMISTKDYTFTQASSTTLTCSKHTHTQKITFEVSTYLHLYLVFVSNSKFESHKPLDTMLSTNQCLKWTQDIIDILIHCMKKKETAI